MKVNVSKAAALSGVSRNTIYKDLENGVISGSQNGRGKTVIDVSELARVYENFKLEGQGESKEPADQEKEVIKDVEKRSLRSSNASTDQAHILKERCDAYEREIELLKSSIEKAEHDAKSEIEFLREALIKEQENVKNANLLLEDKSGDRAGEWEKSMRALEARISNQEKKDKEQKEREEKMQRQNRALKKALDAEKNKSFFQRLFG